MKARICIVCDAPFQTTRAALSCSPVCRAVRTRDVQKVYEATAERRDRRNRRETAARAAARPAVRMESKLKTRTCPTCSVPFETAEPRRRYCSKRCVKKFYAARQAESERAERAARPRFQRNCLRCDSPFETSYIRKVYCTRECLKTRSAEPPALKLVCEVCSTPLKASGHRRKYCSNSCLRRAFPQRHPDDGECEIDGSIKVRDLDECPRRLRVARLAAWYSPDALPEEFVTVVPARWSNPADKRAGR